VTKDDVVCDLGCGDGPIVVTAARRYGCRAVGYDLDPLRVRKARWNAAQNGVADLVTIEQKAIFKADLRPERVIRMTSPADDRRHTLYLRTCPLPPVKR
jgi:ribosomal protein L11 methylase PrmA